MPVTESRLPFVRASADALIATVAGGLVLLMFYPLTLAAAGEKSLVRKARRPPLAADPH